MTCRGNAKTMAHPATGTGTGMGLVSRCFLLRCRAVNCSAFLSPLIRIPLAISEIESKRTPRHSVACRFGSIGILWNSATDQQDGKLSIRLLSDERGTEHFVDAVGDDFECFLQPRFLNRQWRQAFQHFIAGA